MLKLTCTITGQTPGDLAECLRGVADQIDSGSTHGSDACEDGTMEYGIEDDTRAIEAELYYDDATGWRAVVTDLDEERFPDEHEYEIENASPLLDNASPDEIHYGQIVCRDGDEFCTLVSVTD